MGVGCGAGREAGHLVEARLCVAVPGVGSQEPGARSWRKTEVKRATAQFFVARGGATQVESWQEVALWERKSLAP